MAFPIKFPNDNVPGNVCVKKSDDYIGHDQKWVQIKSGQQCKHLPLIGKIQFQNIDPTPI